jgi:hypothetical protein
MIGAAENRSLTLMSLMSRGASIAEKITCPLMIVLGATI